MLRLVAGRMGTLRKQVVFLGGTVVPLLLTRQVALDVRLSKDVDFIVDFNSKQDLYEFEDELWEQGFKKKSTGAVCRWLIDNVTVDVLPADPDILGFNNRWFAEGMPHAQQVDIGKGIIVNIISAPYFLGVKLNAFHMRARDDYVKSSDVYDVVLIIAGRPEIEREILGQASLELKVYLLSELKRLLNESGNLCELGPRYFQGNQAFKRLLPEVVSRIKSIITTCTV